MFRAVIECATTCWQGCRRRHGTKIHDVAPGEPATDRQRAMPDRCKHSHARAVGARDGGSGRRVAAAGPGSDTEWRNMYITVLCRLELQRSLF